MGAGITAVLLFFIVLKAVFTFLCNCRKYKPDHNFQLPNFHFFTPESGYLSIFE